MEDNRIIIEKVPEHRLDLDPEVQAHHAMLDLAYDLADPEMLSCERAELESRMDAMVTKRRTFLRLEGSLNA
jgi:hypothetical protein